MIVRMCCQHAKQRSSASALAEANDPIKRTLSFCYLVNVLQRRIEPDGC